MALDQDKIEKVLRAFSHLLKHRSRLSSPDRVRDLRTASRRLEAAVHALMFDRQRPGNQLLKVVARSGKRQARYAIWTCSRNLPLLLQEMGKKSV